MAAVHDSAEARVMEQLCGDAIGSTGVPTTKHAPTGVCVRVGVGPVLGVKEVGSAAGGRTGCHQAVALADRHRVDLVALRGHRPCERVCDAQHASVR